MLASPEGYKKIWHSLLPGDVVVSDGHLHSSYPDLNIVETNSLDVQNVKQLASFKAGRYHAKLALSKLGLTEHSLPRLPSGEPMWPTGSRGSITHTADYVAVAVSQKRFYIGIDCEFQPNIAPRVWPIFLSKDELSWLTSLPPNLRIALATQLWSIKECAIKATGIIDMRCIHTKLVDLATISTYSIKVDNVSLNLTGKANLAHNYVFATVY